MYVCTYVRTYVCMYVCMYVCECMYVCMYVCECMYACIYVCMPVGMKVWMYGCIFILFHLFIYKRYLHRTGFNGELYKTLNITINKLN